MLHLDTHVVVWLYAGEIDRFPPYAAALLRAHRPLASPMVRVEFSFLMPCASTSTSASPEARQATANNLHGPFTGPPVGRRLEVLMSMSTRTAPLLLLALLVSCDEWTGSSGTDACEPELVPTLALSATRPQYAPDGSSPDANDANTWLDQARRVELDACADLASETGLVWTARAVVDGVAGEAFPIDVPDACQVTWQVPFEGTYHFEVQAEVNGTLRSGEANLEVRDTWIVILGDSYSSGEGVPDSAPDELLTDVNVCEIWVWGDGSDPTWRDAQCHRSQWAWGNKVARRYQDEHPDTQVIVTFLACSGAKIDVGLLEPYRGVTDGSPLAPQVSAVIDIIQSTSNNSRDVQDPRASYQLDPRRPDVVMMTAGGNDAGFADFIKDCTIAGCAWDDILNGADGPDVLPLAFDALSAAIPPILPRRPPGATADGVFIPEYGDPTRDEDGEFDACWGELATALQTDWDMGFAYHEMFLPINEHVRAAIADNNWQLIEGIPEVTRTHGICSSSSWVVGVQESCETQGDELGTFHPNGDGHQAYALKAYDHVAPWLETRPSETPTFHVPVLTDDASGTAWDGAVYEGPVTLTAFAPRGVTATLWVDGADVGPTHTLVSQGGTTVFEVVVRSSYTGVDGDPIPLPDRSMTLTSLELPGDIFADLELTMLPINAKPAVAKPVQGDIEAWGAEWVVGTHLGAVTVAWSHPDPSVTVTATLRSRADHVAEGQVVTSPHRFEALGPTPGPYFGTDTLQGFFLDLDVARGAQTGHGVVLVQVARSLEALRENLPFYTVSSTTDPVGQWNRWDRVDTTTWTRSGAHVGPYDGGYAIDIYPQYSGFFEGIYQIIDDGSGFPIVADANQPIDVPGDYHVSLFACLNDYEPCEGGNNVSGFPIHDLDIAVQ